MSNLLVTHYLTHYGKVKNILMQHKNLSKEEAEDCLHNLYFKCVNTKASIDNKTLPQYFNRMVNNAAAEHIRTRIYKVIQGDEADSVLASMTMDYDLEDMYYNEEQKALLYKAAPVINSYKRCNIKALKKSIFKRPKVLPTTLVEIKPVAKVKQKKRTIPKELLQELVKTDSIDQIRGKYGWSKMTIVKYCRIYGITPKGVKNTIRWGGL